MALYARLIGTESPRINGHAFMGAMAEWERGNLTGAQIATMFELSAGEQTEAQTLFNQIIYPRDGFSIGSGPITLTNVGTTYDGTATALGLGSVLVQTAGITHLDLMVRVNKVGSGTQSWQLWNDSDGAEIMVIDDAGAAGVKNLQGSRDFPTPLPVGLKLGRIRAKSTVGADDPIYLGAALSVRRAKLLTGLELHELLLLAQHDSSPYHDEAALKTRLGV